MEGLGNFREIWSDWERLCWMHKTGKVGCIHFVRDAYEMLGKLEHSGDPKVRRLIVPSIEEAIRTAWLLRVVLGLD